MTDDFTPSDAHIRSAYLYVWREHDEPESVLVDRGLEFDRWLAEHDRVVTAEAFRDAAVTVESWPEWASRQDYVRFLLFTAADLTKETT